MRKKKINILSTIIFALLFGFLALTSAEAVDDFSGDWQGLWDSDYGLAGGLSVQVNQNGASVSGKITVRNTECGTFSNLPVTGNISNNMISIYANAYCPDDGSDNSLRFTRGVLSNNTISGVYSVYSDGEFYDRGTFTLNRSINYIQASAGGGGTITPSGKVSVNAGADQTFNIVPDNGYKILDVKVDGVSVGAKTSYTFNNISANHTITATFEILAKATSIIVPNIVLPLLLDGN